MSTVKIGILTFHRCINYGSYWQARSLVDGLRARGHEVVVLDHRSWRVDAAEWKCALRPVPGDTRGSDRSRYRRKILRFFRAIEALPLSARFGLDDPAGMEPCDLVVVGSDEVWNLSHPWYGRCALFYGDGVHATRLVSYAASFGSQDPDAGLERYWTDKLRTFDLISVRDECSRAIVANALGVQPEVVLDPCLQFPVAAGESAGGHRAPYVAIYGHEFSPSFVDRIRRWARRRRLALVSIGYRNPWADRQWLAAGPHEFAHFIAGAEAVATNFFHGCVFALRHAKPFVCEASHYRGNKLRCLMSEVGGEQHLLPEAAPAFVADALLDGPLDPRILERIDRRRLASSVYLDRALALPA